MNNSPTTKEEYSQECISLRCKDTKNYPKSGHWSCKCCCHFSQPSEEKEVEYLNCFICKKTDKDHVHVEKMSEEKECTCFRPFHNSVEGIIHQKDCPLIAPKQEEWEEKIYDLLSTTEPLGKGFKVVKTDAGTANEIIDLIRQLLKKEREKVIEEVKKNTKDLTKYETEFTCPCGQEHSVQFLIRKPKVMKGKITEITINSQQLKK